MGRAFAKPITLARDANVTKVRLTSRRLSSGAQSRDPLAPPILRAEGGTDPAAVSGREAINLPGKRLATIRYAPIAANSATQRNRFSEFRVWPIGNRSQPSCACGIRRAYSRCSGIDRRELNCWSRLRGAAFFSEIFIPEIFTAVSEGS
jgi:hypothetical protein